MAGDQQPQVAPTKKGEELKVACEYLLWAHGVVAVIKIILGGFGAGSGDLMNMVILWCGYSRYDYC